jgi:glutamate synthase domain-containing protein 3
MEQPTVVPAVAVPEVRDYHRINAELARLLDRGHNRVRLVGVEGQRLLAAGLAGAWRAVVEVEGRAGPELAAGLDAPAVIVVAYGGIGDGGARDLRAGSVVVLGDVGTAFAYRQRGGIAVAAGWAGPRAGLEQAGGCLVLAGPAGPLLGERQAGGRIFALGPVGPHAGRGRRGGRLLLHDDSATPQDHACFRDLIQTLRPWLPPTLGAASWPGRNPDR